MRFVYHDPACDTVDRVMSEVPWWYGTIAHVMAIALSVWVGLHYRVGVEWLVLYGAAAAASAALPTRRFFAIFGLTVGLSVALGGLYLMRDAHIVPADLLLPKGGALAAPREALALACTAVWLLAGSALRFRWA